MNVVEKEMDVYEISNMLFNNKLSDSDIFDIYSEDLKTYFEMLVIIFTEGLKFFFGNQGKVDINKLSLDDFEKINTYLKQIKVNANLTIFSLEEWCNQKYNVLNYDKIKITNMTKLNELNFIIESNYIYVINFSYCYC